MALFSGPKRDPDAQRLAELETIIAAGVESFTRVAQALAEIRDQQLYRRSHGTFAEYVQERWGMTARRAYQLIAAGQVAENVKPVSHVQPTAKQAAELSKLPADQQPAAWVETLATTPTPTAADVAAVVEKRKPRKKSRRPKPLRIRVPGGLVIVERRAADLDPVAVLQEAIAKLSQQKAAA